ncbi:hypothetical protein [Faecalibaculum rodentium]|jgi:foldase protein PrsA|uniref:Peptidylprolyl isomerase n=2 Tax=Faecalibaculum rodentium TaxID=1702221 RepID=A0A1Q9YM16_9FIRM|nr:hypothetical protein [Faecalibaculum rodentium]OLU46029.1 hypothetical protein BO223_03235 [Faecalibaculum rodentium]
MRNKSWIAAGAAGLLFLAGCSGATASVSDPDKELMTIGDVTYTRGQEYEYIKKSTGPNLVMQMAEEVIYDKEVPVTDEIRKQAEDNYNEYAKTSDNLESYIQSMGYKDRQDYIDKVLIPAVQAEKLLTKWFTDAQEEIVQEYKPSRAQIIQTDSKDSADKALQALKDGKSAQDVAGQYQMEGTSYNGTAAIVTTMDTVLPTRLINTLSSAESKAGVVNEVFENDDKTQFFVAVLVSNNYDDIKGELESTLKNDSTVTEKCLVSYLTKYDFRVFDQDIFDYLRVNYPQYLVTRPDLMESADAES